MRKSMENTVNFRVWIENCTLKIRDFLRHLPVLDRRSALKVMVKTALLFVKAVPEIKANRILENWILDVSLNQKYFLSLLILER